MRSGIVQQIFNEHFPAVDQSIRLDARSRWAAQNIRTCRTPAQGFHVDACPNGDYQTYISSSLHKLVAGRYEEYCVICPDYNFWTCNSRM
jgi:hypothetical protein